MYLTGFEIGSATTITNFRWIAFRLWGGFNSKDVARRKEGIADGLRKLIQAY
jgi:hypothetical protein